MAMRSVIVDDSPHFLVAASALLEQDGFAIVGVASPRLTRCEVRKLDPDVVLVDVELGTESGLELAQRIHTETSLDPSKVILISTHSEDNLPGLVSASPARAFLPKLGLSASAIRRSWVGMASPAPEPVILRPRLTRTGRPAVRIGRTGPNSCQPEAPMVAGHDDARLAKRHP